MDESKGPHYLLPEEQAREIAFGDGPAQQKRKLLEKLADSMPTKEECKNVLQYVEVLEQFEWASQERQRYTEPLLDWRTFVG